MADGTSIGDTLRAAIEEGKGGASPVEAVGEALAGRAPSGDAPAPAAAEPAPAAAETTQTEPTAAGAPQRDESGRFKAKAGQEGAQAAAPAEPQQNSETAKPAGEGPQSEATRIPPSLTAAVKAQWSELPQTVRDEFARLEDSFQKGKAEWAPRAQRLNRYDEIIGPHLDKWRMNGLDEHSGIQTLIAAQSMLERDPVGGIVQIARSYGYTPQQLVQQLAGQAPVGHEAAQPNGAPHVPDLSAALQPFMARVQTLEQQLHQQAQASEATAQAEANAAVEAFRTDPANLYFENVRDDVARRLGSGAAKTLAEAYDQAVWASPEIRPHLLADQAKQAQSAAAAKQAEDAKRQKSQQASHAAGSVTGSPTPGAQPLTPGPSLALRDELAANMKALRAAV